MPATTPIWVISCWAALITPSSSIPTSLDEEAAVDGVTMPMPMPDRARATMTRDIDGVGPNRVKASMEAVSTAAPTTVDSRSPTLTAAYPASGATSENMRGRAVDTSPALVSE